MHTSEKDTELNPWVECPWEFNMLSSNKGHVEEAIELREKRNAEFLKSHPEYKTPIPKYAVGFNPESGMYFNIEIGATGHA